MHFHTHVQPYQEEIEIQAQADSPVCGDALSQCLEIEHGSASCRIIIFQCPDISGISEYRSFKFPEHIEPVFQIGFQSHVSCLVRDYERTVPFRKSRADSPCLPSSQTVGSSSVKMLLEREGIGISVCMSGSGYYACRD